MGGVLADLAGRWAGQAITEVERWPADLDGVPVDRASRTRIADRAP